MLTESDRTRFRTRLQNSLGLSAAGGQVEPLPIEAPLQQIEGIAAAAAAVGSMQVLLQVLARHARGARWPGEVHWGFPAAFHPTGINVPVDFNLGWKNGLPGCLNLQKSLNLQKKSGLRQRTWSFALLLPRLLLPRHCADGVQPDPAVGKQDLGSSSSMHPIWCKPCRNGTWVLC